MEIAIKKFENNPSVQIIKNNINVGQAFNFKQIELNDMIHTYWVKSTVGF